MSNDQIAGALEQIAKAIEKNPAPMIGYQSNVTSYGGSAVGGSITAIGGPGRGRVVGMEINVVSSGQRDPAELALIKELMDAAAAARAGSAPKSWLQSLLQRSLANAAVATIVTPGIKALFD